MHNQRSETKKAEDQREQNAYCINDTMDFLQHQLESATFWFGQAMYLSKNNTRDVIKLAECLILRKQFHRASTLLKQQGLDQGGSLEGLYLAAKAAFQSGDLKEALLIIENCSEMCSKAKEDLDCLYEETTRKKQQPTKFTR